MEDDTKSKVDQVDEVGLNQTKSVKRVKKYICHYVDCQKKFSDNYHLVRHIKSCHTLEKPYKCLKCEKRFAISERLAQHVKIYHKRNYQTLKCSHENCEFQTILEDRLKQHLVKHQTSRKFICEVCDKLFLTRYELIRHKKRFHQLRQFDTKETNCDSYSDQNKMFNENRTLIEVFNEDINCFESDQTQRPVLSGKELKETTKE